MEITKIEDTDHEDFKESWEIYEYSFPTDERRGIEKQKEVLNQEEYSFSSIKDEDTVTGMIATWDFDTISFIEHIAIKKECRGKGIGTKIMKEHCEKNNKKI